MDAYTTYEVVRGEVLRTVDAPGEMPDASPSTVETLRRHVGGACPDEYDPHDDEGRRQFETKLRMLSELEGDALLVPEAPALGGFGYEIDGALYNSDTLEFFESLVALERGAVLDEIRAPGRRLVWEIGAGWGGFAYQFKTLFPDVTYVVVDQPEHFLFSATYLMTVFPNAKLHFHGDGGTPPEPEGVDFAFVPASETDSLRGLQPDLTLSLASFEGMTAEQAEGCGRLAWELGCPFVYSSGGHNAREVLGRYYWMHEVPLLEFAPRPLRKRLLEQDASLDQRHAVGWRRART